MRFKLDENLDPRVAALLAEGGHDVDSVRDEGLSGHSDPAIYSAIRSSRRVLVTLDMDFANPFHFPPEGTEGIVVVRVPRPLLSLIRSTIRGALPALKSGGVRGALWIVEPGRIRVHDPERGPELP